MSGQNRKYIRTCDECIRQVQEEIDAIGKTVASNIASNTVSNIVNRFDSDCTLGERR